MRSAQLRVLTNFGCAAGLLLLLNGRVTPTQFVDYRPSSDSIWNQASSAVSTAASSLGLMEGGTSRESDIATADALTAFQALSKSGFGDKVGGARAAVAVPEATAQSPAAAPGSAAGTITSTTGSTAGGLSGCLITKWSAVWLVHADKTRSHVGYPPPAASPRLRRLGRQWLGSLSEGSRWRGSLLSRRGAECRSVQAGCLRRGRQAAACHPTDGRVVGDRRNRYAEAAPPYGASSWVGCGSEQWRRMDAILVTALQRACAEGLPQAAAWARRAAAPRLRRGECHRHAQELGPARATCRTARVCRTWWRVWTISSWAGRV